jgi:1-acyl-sn-glycerol-3-phosphate acyltransferase
VKAALLVKHAGRGLFAALAELGALRMSPPRDPRAAAHRLAGAVGAVAREHDLVVTVRGEVPRGRALIVANHVGYLDPIAILPVCPAIPVAKGEVLGWPVVGPLMQSVGAIFVRRRDPAARARALRRIHDLLVAGAPVLNFPEGTTTPGDRVLPFFRGSFGIAQRLDVPVIPVAIRYDDPALAWYGGASFVPHYLRVAQLPRIAVTLQFGAAMWPRAGEPAEVMAARARAMILRMLDHAKEPHAGSSTDLSPTRPDPVLPATLDDGNRERGRRGRRRAA